MGPGFSDEPTLPIHPHGTSPLEIAREHQAGPTHPGELPETIGPYKILAILGDGGMGIVYLAEQSTPSRRVAIKIIHPRKKSKEILARFDIEREALALMDHPNIAKVFDAGEAVDGRPYFVMEYVHGIPITEYCDRNRLTTNQRLGLFVDVCHAVHHAHQKGIIHRDIKPSNVLVSIQEDKPTPKVIDFGVAKATQYHLTEKTIFTEQGQLIGTPGYMSPEQADLSALDVDTRSDIYSLGVLLYELLVGEQPFDTWRLLSAGFGEIQRVIREVDPPKPSTRFSSLGDTSTVVAHNRGTAVRSLSRELRGDLDWITMKCLEKDRTRRYDSATALADDIERHLRAEPVLAGPPSALYRMRKFTRRHRYGVGAGVGVAAALIAGFIGTAIQYTRANQEWARAEVEAATAKEVKNFMIGLFKISDPGEALGSKITAKEVLDRSANQIPTQLTNRPLVHAALLDAIGNVYGNLGLYDRAEDLLRRAVKIYSQETAATGYNKAQALHHLGRVLEAKGDYDEAEACHQEGLAICQREYGRDHVVTSESLADLALSQFDLDRRDEAERTWNEVLAIRRKLLPSDDPLLAAALMEVGRTAHAKGEVADAEKYYLEALNIDLLKLGPTHPETVECKRLLAHLAYKKEDYDEAIRRYAEVLELLKMLYGPEDTHVAACMNNYATVLSKKKEFDNARAMALEALRINRERLGPSNMQVASDLNLLGAIHRTMGEYSTAEKYCRDSLAIRLEIRGPNHEMVGASRLNLGSCLAELGRFEDAEREMLEAIRVYESANGDKLRLKHAYGVVADFYGRWGKPDQEVLFRNKSQP